MLSGICTWYNPKGRLTKDQVCAVFVEMVQGAVFDTTAKSHMKPKVAAPRPRGKHVA